MATKEKIRGWERMGMVDKRQESCHTQQGGRGGGKRDPAALESGGHHTGGEIGKQFLWCSHFKERRRLL